MNPVPRNMRSAHAIPALCCAVALFAASAGHAADKAKEGAFGKPKPGSLLLSRAELRECLAQKERIRVQSEEMQKQQDQLARDKEEIVRLGAELKDKLAALDRSSQEAVDQYNVEAAARDKLIDAYEAATPGFNAKVDVLTAQRDAFAKACGNRRYDEKDELAIQRGK
ncbi:MAG TPA: hypothetical protein VKI18_10555 [Albitalea sp.]|nr:hypothetical protein [Albitalea sp.]